MPISINYDLTPISGKKLRCEGITDEINRITGIPKDAIVIAFHELPAEKFCYKWRNAFRKV